MDPISGIALTTNVISAFIGRQLFSQAITNASYSIYGSVTDIFSYSNKVDEVLIQLDIKERVKTVDLLIKDITEYTDTISNCISNLHDIILLIREDLKQINYIIKLHKQKFFCNWRRLDCKLQLNNLKIHSILLDKRLDYLIKALDIIQFKKKNQECGKIGDIKFESKNIENKKRNLIPYKLAKLIKND